jgi:hypothetical protein
MANRGSWCPLLSRGGKISWLAEQVGMPGKMTMIAQRIGEYTHICRPMVQIDSPSQESLVYVFFETFFFLSLHET